MITNHKNSVLQESFIQQEVSLCEDNGEEEADLQVEEVDEELSEMPKKQEVLQKPKHIVAVPHSKNGRSILVRMRMADFRKVTNQIENRRRSFERQSRDLTSTNERKKATFGPNPASSIEILSGNLMNTDPSTGFAVLPQNGFDVRQSSTYQ